MVSLADVADPVAELEALRFAATSFKKVIRSGPEPVVPFVLFHGLLLERAEMRLL
jgi:hypothetical protein